jgi:hypothetical protein
MRILLLVLAITFHAPFLYAEKSSFKLTFGSNLGNIPLEINKINKNKKILSGIKMNSWILSPNFSSFVGNKKILNFTENKKSKEKEILYMRFSFKF